MINTRGKIEIRTAKSNKSLPVVLNRSEIKKLINITKNQKHRLLLSIAYGAGLRVSEVINLKTKYINLEDLTLHIKTSKGKKDRITIFPEAIKDSLTKIVNTKGNNEYIFSSERGGKLTTRTAQIL